MLKHYRKSDWRCISKKYLPEIKKQFGYKPFLIEEIEDENVRKWFDEIWLGGGLKIYTALNDENGKKVYRFQVIEEKKSLYDDWLFKPNQAKGMFMVLLHQFGNHTFYVEEIKDSFIRNNFEKLVRSCSGSNYCIMQDSEGDYEDESGQHYCYYIPKVVGRGV